METLIIILAILAGVIGIAGSILPGLPGAPISLVGLCILYKWGNGIAEGMTMKGLIIWGAVVLVITLIDYVIPMYFTKMTGGSKYAERGALIGLFAGIILTPVGMILGSFLGAFLAELCYAHKPADQALKAALGSFLGFLLGTGIKTIVAVLLLWRILVFAI